MLPAASRQTSDRGADLNRIKDVSRHVDPRKVRTYIRWADRHKGSCWRRVPMIAAHGDDYDG